MTAIRRLSALAAAGLAATALAACSSGGGGGGGGDCATDLRIVQESAGVDATATSAVAASLQGGAAYTVYAGDFEVSADDVSFAATPEPPAGSAMATIAITQFNVADPATIEGGTTVEASTATGELVFVVTVTSDSGLAGNNAGISGSLTVDRVGDTLCLTVDYADDEKSVSGTVGAAVKEL